MKTILRKPAALAVGFLASIFISSAAPAQTPADGAARKSVRDFARPFFVSHEAPKYEWPAYTDPYSPLSLFGTRPRTCFCDEDCYAALLSKQRLQLRRTFAPPPVLRLSELKPETEIRVIDFDGLKKLLQRDPNDTRPMLVNFWATWCDPCREEFPDLVKIDADYGAKNLNFVTVSLDDVADINSEVPKFLKEMKATMPTVLLNVNDPEPAIKAVDAAWDGQLPATFLYDKDGKVVFRHFGRIKADELRAAIDKTIK